MKTNFFEHIANLKFQGNLNLTINIGAGEKLTVSLYLTADIKGDKAVNAIPPMILKGDAQELDEGFFTAIETPVQKTTQLFANMEAYQKGLEKTQQQSKMEQDKKAKNGKAKTEANNEDDPEDNVDETENLFNTKEAEQQQKAEKKKAYEDAMKQVGDLNSQLKYDEAITLLPKVEDYPHKEAEIKRKLGELQKRKETFDALKLDL